MIDIFKKERVFDRFVKISEIGFTLPDGRNLSRMVVERGDSVSALVVNISTEVCYLVEQTRIATGGRFLEIMAGMIDEGETPEVAVLRELKEELGFEEVHSLEYVGKFYLSPGLLTEINHCFIIYVTSLSKRNDNRGINDEDILSIEIPVKELVQMFIDGKIQDAKTAIAFQYLLLSNTP
jgi:ADP-ribose pyrophosphatase